MNELEGIELSQVVGINNNEKTVVVAFVILEQGSTLTVEKMKIHCQSLAYFKRPKHFFVVD